MIINEKLVDGSKTDFKDINTGDIVKWSLDGMSDIPSVGDQFRVGPITGKCIMKSNKTVTMKVTGHSFK